MSEHFTCNKHGYLSLNSPCPACHPPETLTSDSTTPTSWKSEEQRVLEAARVIKEYCRDELTCERCPILDGDKCGSLRFKLPMFWKLPTKDK